MIKPINELSERIVSVTGEIRFSRVLPLPPPKRDSGLADETVSSKRGQASRETVKDFWDFRRLGKINRIGERLLSVTGEIRFSRVLPLPPPKGDSGLADETVKRIFGRLAGALFLSISLFSCTTTSEKSSTNLLVRDDSGKELSVSPQTNKIVSVSPSVTEMLSLLVDSARIQATSIYCSYPERWASKMKVNPYPLDVEALVRLQPDIILTKRDFLTLSEIQRCRELNLPLYVMKFDSVSHIFAAVKQLGRIVGDTMRAAVVHDSLRSAWDSLKANPLPKATCIVLISFDLYAFGKASYVTELLAVSGGENVADSQQPFPQLSRESILRADPEVMIAGDGMDWVSFFDRYPELKRIKAYQQKRLYNMNGDLLSRPGPRFMEACYRLRELLATSF